MKKSVCSSLLVICAIMGLELSASPAHAGEMIRMSQKRLADLGYFPGREDGVMGPVTRTAVRDFQSYNGLPATGNLDSTTVSLLISEDYSLYSGRAVHTEYTRYAMPYRYVGYYNNGYVPATTSVTYYDENGHVVYNNGYIPASTMPVAYYDANNRAVYNNGYYNNGYIPASTMPVAYYGADGRAVYTNAVWHY
jgi:peptidoglycan hydrolase-like protein with peptidoglycan-binding domain